MYVEALYTVKHKIGRTIDGHSDYMTDLNLYLQDAFKFSSDDHKRLLAKVTEEKVIQFNKNFFMKKLIDFF